MVSEGLLLCSQEPSNCLYTELHEHSPQHHINFKIHINIVFLSTPRFHSFKFPHQNPVCIFLLPLRAICPANLFLLDLINLIIMFGEDCTLRLS